MEKNSKVTPIRDSSKEKISYEQLKNYANDVAHKYEVTKMQLNQAEMIINTFKRLDYLLKIIAQKEAYSPEFIKTCVNEVETMMTLPEEEESTEEKK